MKPSITLNQWRFELLKSPESSWQQLRVGGMVAAEEGGEERSVVDVVIDLQAFREKQQFKPGFILETENYTVTLGKQERV